MPVVWSAVGATVLPNIGGWLGGIITIRNIKPWYEGLVRPSWRPPNRAFGPVWTVLYCGMGYGSYLVWRDAGGFDGPGRIPLALYGTQLLLNWAWTPIFFGAHNLGLGLIDLSLLWVNVAACGYSFYHINPTAGLLMIPYLAWLTVAFSLNYCIYRDNPPKIKELKNDEGKKD